MVWSKKLNERVILVIEEWARHCGDSSASACVMRLCLEMGVKSNVTSATSRYLGGAIVFDTLLRRENPYPCAALLHGSYRTVYIVVTSGS